MKTSSRDLFNLIRAMTKSEKGYFKKHAGFTGSNKIYLKLFDAIDAQKVYDEDQLREKFKGEQFVKQISVAKNNLYSRILRYLNQSAISGNEKFELRTNVNYAEILFNKGLDSQAVKLLAKLKTQAEETEELDILLQLLSLEKTILLKSFADNQKELNELYKEELIILQKRESFISYQQLFNKAYYLLMKFGHIRNKADEKVYKDILNSRYMKDPTLAKTVLAKFYYHQIFIYYTVSNMQPAEALKHTSQCVKLFEKNTALLNAHIDKYLAVYQNHILQYFYLNRFKEIESNSQKLLAILRDKKVNVPERAKITSLGKLYCIRLVALVNSGEFEGAMKMFTEIEKYFNEYKGHIDISITSILYNIIGYLHFVMKDYPEALKWINLLLNDPEMKYFVETTCNARWFELLIHFEMGNYSYIDDVLSSHKRYLDRKARLYGIERLMIQFLTKAVAGSDLNALYEELFYDVKTIRYNMSPGDYGIDYYNIYAWSQSKAEKRSLPEVIKSNPTTFA